MNASIVITSKDRKEDLRRALHSTIAQNGQPEIIVIDDGSTDGTAEMVRSEFPEVKLERYEESKGLVVRRNEAARLALGDVIFSIDDDAIFSTSHVVEQTLLEFDSPEIGAVAIPYIELRNENRILQRCPSDDKIWIAPTFIGTAHALRRDLFLQLGGYREFLFHQGEEPDYCIRLLDTGYVVRLGHADLIEHHQSPKRDLRRMDFYGCRNAILFAWQNVPMPYLPVYLMATTFNCLRWTFAPRRFWIRLRGILAGYGDCLRTSRAPVTTPTYRKWRKLKSEEAVPMTDL
jgi:glycosyltransferase involved in cell wall biosynthesis